jgi:hypothetical protein
MKWLLTILFLFPFALFAQDTLLIEGRTFVDTLCDVSYGVQVNRTTPKQFIFKNNSVTGCNTTGYMLEAGQETTSNYTNNFRGAEIIGNKFNWVGDQNANTITHGIFTGYHADVKIMYNYLDHVPMGIIRKSNGLTDTAGVVAYNIIVSSPAVGIVVKGMNGVRIYNNTLYSADSAYTAPGIGTWRGLIDIYENDNPVGSAKGVKIKNNIFYTKKQITTINVMNESCLEGFESDHNIFWCETGEPVFMIAGNRVTWAQWRERGYDTHSRILNPYFKDFINFVPEFRLQWGIPTEFDMGIAMSDYWKAGFDMQLVKQRGYWQQGAKIYEGDMVIFFQSGQLLYGDSISVPLTTGKITLNQSELIIEQ